MRSASITTALLLALPAALASFSQGTVNLTRDYSISYTGYANTEAFCRKFRKECVVYNSFINHHHQLDCVFAQPGPVVRAFCGGVQKDAGGNWHNGETITPYTTAMIGRVPHAKIVGPPIKPHAPVKVVLAPSHPAGVSGHPTFNRIPSLPTPAAPKPKKDATIKRKVYSTPGLCKRWKHQCVLEAAKIAGSGHLFRCKPLSPTVMVVTCVSRNFQDKSVPEQQLTDLVITDLGLSLA